MSADLSAALKRTLEHEAGVAAAVGAQWLDPTWIPACAAAVDRALAERGIGAGDPVALIARNRPAHVAAIAALLAGRRTVVMVHAAQGTTALAQDIARLAVRCVIADAEDWSAEARAAAEANGLPGLALETDGRVRVLDGSANGPSVVTGAPVVTRRPEVAIELLSSGTTGTPKRIPLSWHAVNEAVADADAVYAAESGQGGGLAVVVHPIANVAGVTFLLPALARGRPFVLLEKFRLDDWLTAIRTHRPNRVSVPPAAIVMLLDAALPAGALASLTSVGVGGGRLDPARQEEFEERFGIPILPGYGATEFGGVIANWSMDLHRQYARTKRGSAGRVRPGMTLRIVCPDTGAPLPPGATGLLEARVPRIGPDFITTSDLGRIDEDGFLFLEGRADQAINRGGFTVRPDDVTAVLKAHEAVADAVVFGRRDDRLGEAPVGLYECRVGADVSEADLLGFARARLAGYQVPVRLLRVAALPRTGSVKVSLPESRALLEHHITQSERVV